MNATTQTAPFSLCLTVRGQWQNVDAGHRMNTALQNRGMDNRGRFETLEQATDAAQFLARSYSGDADETVECVDVVGDGATDPAASFPVNA